MMSGRAAKARLTRGFAVLYTSLLAGRGSSFLEIWLANRPFYDATENSIHLVVLRPG
jgi:hypothetical protein